LWYTENFQNEESIPIRKECFENLQNREYLAKSETQFSEEFIVDMILKPLLLGPLKTQRLWQILTPPDRAFLLDSALLSRSEKGLQRQE
jgi:hypothetical protein